MRLCIIPDIHNRVDLTKSLIDKEHNNVDKFVMLGDYFDHFFDTPDDVKRTANFLKEILNDKFELLIGNHDLHYIMDHDAFKASTWTQEKFDAVNEVISESDWEKFKWSYLDNRWLFSHSGIQMEGFSEEKLDNILNSHIEEVIENDLSRSSWFSPHGTFWQKYLSDTPYADDEHGPLNQVVGHTVLPKWNMKQFIGYRVYFIDTCSQNYAIVDTDMNEITINSTGYVHYYHPGEIRWINTINQTKFV